MNNPSVIAALDQVEAPALEANIKSKRRAMLHCDYKVKKACERSDFVEAVFYQEVKQELLNLK